jgi:hypothetical protein
MFAVVPVFMAVFGFILMKMLVWDMVDSVWDDGVNLIIKDKVTEDRAPLLNILNVGNSMFTNPPHITLTLREPSKYGKKITFSPPTNWAFWKTHHIADAFISAVGEANPEASGTPHSPETT